VTDEASFLPPYVSLQPIARWAIGLLVATLACAWIAVGVDLHQLRLLGQASGGQDVAPIARAAWTLTDQILFWTQLTVLACTAVGFLAWLLQARVNLRAMGVRRMRYGREWTIAGFLVPFLNFIRPYQVVREVMQGSDPTNVDAFNWRTLSVSRVLGLWWVAFVAWLWLEVMAVLTNIGAQVSLPKLQLATALHAAADVMAAVAAFVACFLVSRITAAQDEKRRILSRGVDGVDGATAPGNAGRSGGDSIDAHALMA